jgi:hypothetical protein
MNLSAPERCHSSSLTKFASRSSGFKRYSQAKRPPERGHPELAMMREALTRLDRQANEHVTKDSGTPLPS